MKGASVELDWRTIQIFLSDDGVHEVEMVMTDTRKMRCTCPVYKQGKRCKHIRYIRAKMQENDGDYSVMIPETLTEEEIETAILSPDTFRQFLVKYSKIEVIP